MPIATEVTFPPAATLREHLAHWRQIVDAELKGAAFEKKLVTRTFEGVPLQPLYTRADLTGLRDVTRLPGEAPFLRGVRAQGYLDRPWEVAQDIPAASAADFNAALLSALGHGQNSVVLALDGPDAANAGLPTTPESLAAALAAVDLHAVPVHLRAGSDALPLATAYLEFTRRRGLAPVELTGSITADPLSHWAKTGVLAPGLPSGFDSLAAWTTWAGRRAPKLRTIAVEASIWADAGGTAVQELALALAGAAEYLRALGHRGVPAAVAGPRFCFRFSAGPVFFTELAKFRAWRPLWTRVLVAFGAEETVGAGASVHASTCRWNQTCLDPHVNQLRATTEALSAVLGGCDSLHISPFDEVAGQTDDFSQRIARNLHTILAEEFSFTKTADPAGGAWYVEALTDRLARGAWALFQDIERRGGLVAALRSGFPQRLVATAAVEKSAAVGTRRLGLVGTNLFPNLKETPLIIAARHSTPATDGAPTADPAASPVGARQGDASLAAICAETRLDELPALLPPPAPPEAVIPVVEPWRASAGFEALRSASADFQRKTGTRPRVFLAKIGPALQHKARADFSAVFFATAGFEVLARQAFDTPESAAQAAAASGAPIAVLCSTDETYPTLVRPFASGAKASRSGGLLFVLAGLPADPNVVAAYRAAGVDEFIHVRANVHDVLAGLLRQIGASA